MDREQGDDDEQQHPGHGTVVALEGRGVDPASPVAGAGGGEIGFVSVQRVGGEGVVVFFGLDLEQADLIGGQGEDGIVQRE